MATSDKSFDRKLAAIYRAEAAEHVQRMRACLGQLEAAQPPGTPAEPLASFLRAAHSLKGAARAVGAHEVEGVCHALESLLLSLQRGRLAWSPVLGDGMAEVLRGLERAAQGSSARPGALLATAQRLERLEREAPAAAAQPPEDARAGKSVPVAGAARAAAAAAAAAPSGTPATDGAPAAADLPAAEAVALEPEVRIGLRRLTRLLYQAEELVSAKLDAAHHVTGLSAALDSCTALRPGWDAPAAAAQAWQELEARLRALKGAAAREQRQLAGAVDALLEDVKQALLLPARSLRPMLQATVQELARSQGKEVELRIEEASLELDRRLVEALHEPLLHLLRNAIGHGIESPQERAAAGKPPLAVLTVSIASRPGGRAEITVADDGRGVDTQRLAHAARERQWPVPPGAGPDELLPLVFVPGLTTAERVTRVAGRGVGLPIVRDTIERMGGTVSVRSEPGRGTTFTLSLSLSFAIYRAVEVRAGGRSFLLPTARVERCLRLGPAQMRALGRSQTVTLGEQDVPLVPLAGLLGLPSGGPTPGVLHCLVLAAGERRIAMAVDEISGEQEVLGKPMQGPLASSPMVAGAAVLGSGLIAAVLNVPELVRTALRDGGRSMATEFVAPPQRGSSVLLAEDSITSRTLLKNILELAGHRVVVAVDGSDALDKLRAGAFDLVVSDVEMPRLDGFGLTQAIRGDPALARLPVILVTSLSSPADRERGAEAGANAYIVKSGFDQGNLLQAIEELA